MKFQKVLITDSENKIQKVIDDGYKIISATAQGVAAGGYTSSTPKGKFLVVFEKLQW